MSSGSDIREWALSELSGVCNVILPSFTADLRSINEEAIRHDVRRNIDLGFTGTLLVSEANTTNEEYLRFVEIAVDEAAGRQILFFHASFNTLEENIEMACASQARGAAMSLLSYPPSFYPQTEKDIIDFTLRFCEAVDLGVMLFPVPLWGFERLHAASISIPSIEYMVDQVPNIVAVKAEGGMPSVAGFAHAWNRLSERIVITMPILQQAIPLATLVPMQLIATSNTEYYGSSAPAMLSLARAGKVDEAMEKMWQIMPAIQASSNTAAIPNAHAVHRTAWKYQAWLNDYNGGPMRMPAMRVNSKQMRALRSGLIESGLEATSDPDEAFFVGRCPA